MRSATQQSIGSFFQLIARQIAYRASEKGSSLCLVRGQPANTLQREANSGPAGAGSSMTGFSPLGKGREIFHGFEGNFELRKEDTGLLQYVEIGVKVGGFEARICPSDHDDGVFAVGIRCDEGNPGGHGTDRIPRVSTPAASRVSRRCIPNASVPSFPIMLTGLPRRAAATAWLAPFPPGKV